MKEKIYAFLTQYFDQDRIIADNLTLTLPGGSSMCIEAWAVLDVQGNVRPLWEVTLHAHRWISSLVVPPQDFAATLSRDIKQLSEGALPAVKSGNYLSLLPIAMSAKKVLSEKGTLTYKVASEKAGTSITMAKNCLTQDILTDPSFISQVLPVVEGMRDAINENKQKAKLQERNWI